MIILHQLLLLLLIMRFIEQKKPEEIA